MEPCWWEGEAAAAFQTVTASHTSKRTRMRFAALATDEVTAGHGLCVVLDPQPALTIALDAEPPIAAALAALELRHARVDVLANHALGLLVLHLLVLVWVGFVGVVGDHRFHAGGGVAPRGVVGTVRVGAHLRTGGAIGASERGPTENVTRLCVFVVKEVHCKNVVQ